MREGSERSGIFVVQYLQRGGKSQWLGQSSKKEEYGRYGKLQGEYATASLPLEQHRWLHTHFEQASAENTATVARGPNTTAEWRFHQGAWDTKHPAITFPVLAKHRSTKPEAPAYPVKHLCSQVQDWQTTEWTTFHPQKAYLLRYVYGYLRQGHEGSNDYVGMKQAAPEIIHQGLGVYATRRLERATATPWATTEQGAQAHVYQPTAPCRLPCPDDRNTVIFADAPGTTNVTRAAGGQPWSYGRTWRADYATTSSQGPPFSGPPLTGKQRHWQSSCTPSTTPTTAAGPHAPCSSGLPDRPQTGPTAPTQGTRPTPAADPAPRGRTGLGARRPVLQRRTGLPLPTTHPHHGAHPRQPRRQRPYESPPT